MPACVGDLVGHRLDCRRELALQPAMILSPLPHAAALVPRPGSRWLDAPRRRQHCWEERGRALGRLLGSRDCNCAMRRAWARGSCAAARPCDRPRQHVLAASWRWWSCSPRLAAVSAWLRGPAAASKGELGRFSCWGDESKWFLLIHTCSALSGTRHF